MLLRVAVADTDQNYIKKLAAGFMDYLDIHLSVYTDSVSLNRALQEKKTDVLLFSENICKNDTDISAAKLPILLLADTEIADKKFAELKRINKYQRISSIYKKILSYFSEIADISEQDAGDTGVSTVAFFSPAGGSGKTTLSLTLAEKLALRGKKVFYLNMEIFPSEAFYLPQQAEKGLSELLACINDHIDFHLKTKSLLQKKGENLYYMNHFDSPNDRYEASPEEWESLLQKLKSVLGMDYIIIDMDSSLDNSGQKIFELADFIMLLERADWAAIEKQRIFYGQAHIIARFGEKMSRIVNFDTGQMVQPVQDISIIGKISVKKEIGAVQFIDALAGSMKTDFMVEAVL